MKKITQVLRFYIILRIIYNLESNTLSHSLLACRYLCLCASPLTAPPDIKAEGGLQLADVIADVDFQAVNAG